MGVCETRCAFYCNIIQFVSQKYNFLVLGLSLCLFEMPGRGSYTSMDYVLVGTERTVREREEVTHTTGIVDAGELLLPRHAVKSPFYAKGRTKTARKSSDRRTCRNNNQYGSMLWRTSFVVSTKKQHNGYSSPPPCCC